MRVLWGPDLWNRISCVVFEIILVFRKISFVIQTKVFDTIHGSACFNVWIMLDLKGRPSISIRDTLFPT